jgi:hypothetical protein
MKDELKTLFPSSFILPFRPSRFVKVARHLLALSPFQR